MSALDTINANGQDYDIMSPEVVSDYVEKIGTICKNPNGYTKGSLFLARDAQNVERMYKATSAIASNQTITSGTNCTVKKLGDLFNDVDSDVSQLKQALANEVTTRAELGAHNLFKFDLAAAKAANTSGTWNDNVYTKSGATFTVNDDDTITINTNGTTATEVYFKVGTASLENGKQYKIVGCPSGGSNNSYLMAYKKDNSTYAIDTGNGASFTYASTDNKSIEIYIRSGQNLVDKVFKPMICVPTDNAATYQPYAMTNKELTAFATDVIVTDVASSFTGITSGTVNMIKYGKLRQLQFYDVTFAGDASFPTLDTADRPKVVSWGTLSVTSDNSSGRIWLRVNGTFGTGNVLGKTVMGALTWIVS